MYKKCDTIELEQGSLFDWDRTKRNECEGSEDLFKKILEEKTIKLAKLLDDSFRNELFKNKIKTDKVKYIKMWLTRKKLEVHLILTDGYPLVKIMKKES